MKNIGINSVCRQTLTQKTDTGMGSGMNTGTDTGIDTGMDTGMDTGRDTGMDTGMDNSMDTGTDKNMTIQEYQENPSHKLYRNMTPYKNIIL